MMNCQAAHPSIKILHGRQAAAQARGIAVVIDVLRAFSTSCYVLAAGTKKLIAVAEVDDALNMKRHYPDAVLIGERQGFRLSGFDMGNSPSRVAALDWQGRTVIMTTTNGTMGLTAAHQADQVLTGSFVNAGAIVSYIRRQRPSPISLVCMGSQGREALEDTLCAEFLKSRLMGRPPDFEPIRQKIRQSPAATRFLAGAHADFPAEDLNLCLCLDRFEFVLRAEKQRHGNIEMVQIQMIPE